MKKTLFLIAIIAIVSFSCKKKEEEDTRIKWDIEEICGETYEIEVLATYHAGQDHTTGIINTYIEGTVDSLQVSTIMFEEKFWSSLFGGYYYIIVTIDGGSYNFSNINRTWGVSSDNYFIYRATYGNGIQEYALIITKYNTHYHFSMDNTGYLNYGIPRLRWFSIEGDIYK